LVFEKGDWWGFLLVSKQGDREDINLVTSSVDEKDNETAGSRVF